MAVCVLIPAYEPEESFVQYAALCAQRGPLVVVDDGSGPKYSYIFEQIAAVPGCTVLHHHQNKGKGAALKTGFAHILNQMPDCDGVVTADCDGQHALDDVQRLCEAVQQRPDALSLGCRHFGPETPRRSMAGNRATSMAMRLLYGIQLEDTQTGLRGIPRDLLEEVAALPGQRYEYELEMLLWAKHRHVFMNVLTIQTRYFDNNQGSHYNTVRDSLRICVPLLRGLGQYMAAGAASAVVDVVAYAILVSVVFTGLSLVDRLLFSAVLARILSSLFNYLCNRRLPQMQRKAFWPTAGRYYILWTFQLAGSVLGTWALCEIFQANELVAKYVVDILLSVLSYQVQLRWVFGEKEEKADV